MSRHFRAQSPVELQSEADQHYFNSNVLYQASSPDEVALVKWTEQVGLAVIRRDLNSISLRTPSGQTLNYTVLHLFPFTSESKRMGKNRLGQEINKPMFFAWRVNFDLLQTFIYLKPSVMALFVGHILFENINLFNSQT